MQVELCEIPLAGAPEILRSETYLAYAATTKDEGNAADERFSTVCKDKTTGKIYIIRMEVDNDTLCLEGENGLGRRLTGKQSLKRTCEKLEDISS
jgi:hypothetical protein